MNTRTAAALVAVALLAAGCSSNADTASRNLSKDAEQFKIERRIVFYNGITDTYMLEVTGRCSIESEDGQFTVTCKVGPDEFVKDFLGLSDNVTYFAEQTEATDADEYRHTVIWKPEAILPNIDIATSADGD